MSQSNPLPHDFGNQEPFLKLAKILGEQLILIQGKHVPQILVKWKSHNPTNATGKLLQEFQNDFPDFHLEGKVSFAGNAIVAVVRTKLGEP